MISDFQGHDMGKITLRHRTDNLRDLNSRVHKIRYKNIKSGDTFFPLPFSCRNGNPFVQLSLLTDDLTRLGKLAYHFFIKIYYLIDSITYLSIYTSLVKRHFHIEVSILYLSQNI